MKKKSILVTFLALACVFCSIIGLTIFSVSAGTTAVVNIVSEDIKDTYSVNSNVEFPESISVSHDGQNYTATNGVIIYPSGISYVLSKNELDEMGEYEIKYFYSNNNLKLTATKKFMVLANYYSFKVEDGSSFESTLNTDETKATSHNGKDSLRVTLKDGNEFLFNEPINLNSISGLAPIINITPVMGDDVFEGDAATATRVSYTPYAKRCIIRLTDCFNPKVYVEIVYDFGNEDSEYQGYFRAGSNNQTEIGIDVGKIHSSPTTSKVNYKQDGVDSRAFIGSYGNYNTAVYNSAGYSGTALYYNNELDRIYYQLGEKSLQMFSDLQNSYLYGKDLFAGFTTGEVYLSLRAEEFVAESVTIDVHSIGKYSAKQLADLGQVEYKDQVAPQIYIEAELTNEKGFYGALGDSISIPKATAVDINLSGEMLINVYKNYYSEKPAKVTVVNNSFIMSSPDTYTIEYMQKDIYGNVGVKCVNVIPKYVENNASIYVETEKLNSLSAGAVNILPSFEIKTLNRLDLAEIKITAVHANQTIEIDLDNLSFIPEYTGEWEITYSLKDNLGTNEYSYKVNCESSDSISFKELPLLPRYFIKGHKYNIGEVFAYSYTQTSPTKNDAEIYVSFDGGQKVKVDSPDAVEITGLNQVQFFYEYNGTTVQSETVKIIDVSAPMANQIDMFKYFVGDVEYLDDLVEEERPKDLTIKAKDNYAKIEFINAIDYENFTFKYSVSEALGNFEVIRLTLTGVEDSSEKTVIEIRKDLKKTSLYIDDYYVLDIEKTFAGDKAKSLSYKSSLKTVSFDGRSARNEIQFTGALVYLDIELIGVTGDSGITITEINAQKFTGAYNTDKVAPKINCHDGRGEYAVGTTINLAVPVFSDVLSQINYPSITLKVVDSEGNVLKAKDGTLLNITGVDALKDYQIVIDGIKSYFVNYSVKDYAGRSTSIKYSLVGIDTEAPTITLDNKDYVSGKEISIVKGGRINVKYSLKDNVTSVENIVSMVRVYNLQTGAYYSVADIQNVSFNRFGKYEVKVLAFDEAGNMAQKTFVVKVS